MIKQALMLCMNSENFECKRKGKNKKKGRGEVLSLKDSL